MSFITDFSTKTELIPQVHKTSEDPLQTSPPLNPSDYDCPDGSSPFIMGETVVGTTWQQVKDTTTCYCEDHCTWYTCRLENPPLDCLVGTNSEWKWDQQKLYWVAQLIEGNSIISIWYHYHCIILILHPCKKHSVNTFICRKLISYNQP